MGSLLVSVRGPDEAVEATRYTNSASTEELPTLWATGVDVICVGGAACEQAAGEGRYGAVSSEIITGLLLSNS